MAGYRQIHTRIWKDEWFGDLEPDEKLLFIYLFSNDESQISGIYKISTKTIVNETGLGREFIKETLAKFENDGRVFYREGILWVVNMNRYHKNSSPLTKKKVDAELDIIPESEIKNWYLYYNNTAQYGIDTISSNFPKNLKKNVILNISVSERVSENDSRAAQDKQELGISENAPAYDSLYPTAEAEAMSIFSNVTGAFGIPASERDNVFDAIRILRKSKSKDEVIEFLRPFYEKFKITAKNKSRTYWLTDWAITGNIPGERVQVEASEVF